MIEPTDKQINTWHNKSQHCLDDYFTDAKIPNYERVKYCLNNCNYKCEVYYNIIAEGK